MELAEVRHARGVDWLDGVTPDWRDKLANKAFDMNSCVTCVLGRLYGHYERSPMAVAIVELHEITLHDFVMGTGLQADHVAANRAFTFWATRHGFYGITQDDESELALLWEGAVKAP